MVSGLRVGYEGFGSKLGASFNEEGPEGSRFREKLDGSQSRRPNDLLKESNQVAWILGSVPFQFLVVVKAKRNATELVLFKPA